MKKYEIPEIKTIRIQVEDVITISGDGEFGGSGNDD